MEITHVGKWPKGAKVGRMPLLREFFFRQGVDTTMTFLAEMKALSVEERMELATLVAAHYDVEVEEKVA